MYNLAEKKGHYTLEKDNYSKEKIGDAALAALQGHTLHAIQLMIPPGNDLVDRQYLKADA